MFWWWQWRGDGTPHLRYGIGTEEVGDEKRDLVKLGRFQLRNRSEGVESWAWIRGRAMGHDPR
jgi:hypothetical protein